MEALKNNEDLIKQIISEKSISFYSEDEDFTTFETFTLLSHSYLRECIECCVKYINDRLEILERSSNNPRPSKLQTMQTLLELLYRCIQENIKNFQTEISEDYYKKTLVPLLLDIYSGHFKGAGSQLYKTEKIASNCLNIISSYHINFIVKTVIKRFSGHHHDDDDDSPFNIDFSCLDLQFSSLSMFLIEYYNFVEKKRGFKLCMLLMFLKNLIISTINRYKDAFNNNLECLNIELEDIVVKWLKYLFKHNENSRIKPFSLPLISCFIFLSRECLRSVCSGVDYKSLKLTHLVNYIDKNLESPKSGNFDASYSYIVKFYQLSLLMHPQNIKTIQTYLKKIFDSIQKWMLLSSTPTSPFTEVYKITMVVDSLTILLTTDEAKVYVRECFFKPEVPPTVRSGFLRSLLIMLDPSKSPDYEKSIDLVSMPLIYTGIYNIFISAGQTETAGRDTKEGSSLAEGLKRSDRQVILQIYESYPKLCMLACDLYENFDLSDLFKEFNFIMTGNNMEMITYSAKILVKLHRPEYLRLWISYHPFKINEFFASLCKSYLKMNLTVDFVAGFLNFMFKIFSLRFKFPFQDLQIKLDYDQKSLIQSIKTIEHFLYVCLLGKDVNINLLIFKLFGCLFEELKLIKLKNEALIEEHISLYQYYSQINEISTSHFLTFKEMFDKLCKIVNHITFHNESLIGAFKILFEFIQSLEIYAIKPELPRKSQQTEVFMFVKDKKSPELAHYCFNLCINFLCSSVFSLLLNVDEEIGTVDSFIKFLVRTLYQEAVSKSPGSGSILSALCLGISEKLNYKLYNEFLRHVCCAVTESELTDAIFPFFNTISHILSKLIYDNTAFRSLAETLDISHLILSLAKISGPTNKALAHVKYRNHLATFLDIYISYLNEFLNDSNISIKHKLLLCLMDWLPPSNEKMRSESITASRATTSSDPLIYQSLNITSILRCICSILRGLSINISLLDDCKFRTKKEFVENCFITLSSYASYENGTKSFNEEMVTILSQCMGNLILSNHVVNTAFLIAIANNSPHEGTWVVVMEALCYIISKTNKLEGLTDDSTIQPYEKIIDIITLEENGRFLVFENIIPMLGSSDSHLSLINMIILAFSCRGKLQRLLRYVFKIEVDSTVGPQTLFRSGSIPVNFLVCSFKIYGESFSKVIVETLFNYLSIDCTLNFEIDPSKVEPSKIPENTKNLIRITEYFMHHLVSLIDAIPNHLCIVCSALYQAVQEKYPSLALTSVGSIFFLRLINPVLINPRMNNPVSQSNASLNRALILLSKIFQSIANQVLNRESMMESLNNTIQSKFGEMTRFLTKLCQNIEEEPSSLSVSEIEDIPTIQNFLCANAASIAACLKSQNLAEKSESIWKELMELKEQRSGGSETEQLLTVSHESLIQTSPRLSNASSITLNIGTMTEFAFKLQDVFFKHGTSKEGHSVFYLNFPLFYSDTLTKDELKKHITDLIRDTNGPWDLVVNSLQIGQKDIIIETIFVELQSKELQNETNLQNLTNIYMINLSATMLNYSKHRSIDAEKFLKNKNIFFINSISELQNYIEEENFPSVIPSLFPSTESSFVVTYLHFHAAILFVERGMILKYRDACSITLNILAYSELYRYETMRDFVSLNWDTIQIDLKGGSSVTISSSQCDQISAVLQNFSVRSKIKHSQSLSSRAIIYDSLGTCFITAVIYLFHQVEEIRKIGINFFKSLVKFIDCNLLQSKILKFETLTIPLKDVVDLNETVARSQVMLTYGAFTQLLYFFKKSDAVTKRYCLQLTKPWMFNLIEFLSKCKSQEKIKIFQVIENLINITITHTECIFDLSEKIWAPLATDLVLVDYSIRSFIKVSLTSNYDQSILHNLLVCSVTLAEHYKLQLTNFLIENLTSFFDVADSFSASNEGEKLYHSLSTHLHFMNYLLKHDSLSLVNTVPIIIYYSLLHLLNHFDQKNVLVSFSLICSCLESIGKSKELGLSAGLSENIRLMSDNAPSLLTKKYKKVKERKDSYVSSTVETSLINPNIELVENLSKTTNRVLALCTSENPQLAWTTIFKDTTCRMAFSGISYLQPHGLILLGLLEDTSVSSMNKLFSLMSKSALQQDLKIFVGCMYALQKYSINFREVDVNLVIKFFWLSVCSFMMFDQPTFYYSLLTLKKVLTAINSLNLTEKFEEMLLESLPNIDRRNSMKGLLKSIGLNFEVSFNFSLCALIIKGQRSGEDRVHKLTTSVLKTLFKMTSPDDQANCAFTINQRNLPYLMALVSFDASINSALVAESPQDLNADYFYIGSLRFESSLKNLILEPILSFLILTKGLEYAKLQADNYYLLKFVDSLGGVFRMSLLAIKPLIKGVLIDRIVIYDEKHLIAFVNNILRMISSDIPDNQLSYEIISSKGLFGFISIISALNRGYSSNVCNHLSAFCASIVQHEPRISEVNEIMSTEI